MMRRSSSLCAHAVGPLMAIMALCADVQAQAADGLKLLDISTARHQLTGGYASWQDTALRGLYRKGDHLWGMDLVHADRFSEKGDYAGLQDTLELNPDWRVSLGYGMGSRVNWLPRYRLDGFVHHNWAAQRNWVTSLGLGEYRAHDEYRSRWASIGLSAYMDSDSLGPWVAQAEVRWTRTDPGQVDTRQQFVALTWGKHRIDQITWRHAWGREGWQALGDARLLVDFASRQDTLAWRHWIDAQWGVRLEAEHYRNDQYRRTGVSLGVFRDFP